jgi:probable phosphoglycerate mutase
MHHVAKPVSTRICFIRHGETDWNVAKRIQGHTDIPLNETGRAQALAMAFNAAHQRFHAIYSSDLTRTMETAQALAQREDQEVIPMLQLRERHYGVFQGITAAEGAERYPQAHAHYVARDLEYDFETGESLRGFAERVAEGIDWLVRHHSGQTIAAVSHSGVLDVVYRRATGRPLHTPRDFVIPNCGLNWFHFDGQGWHLETWADRHYLHDVLTESPE